MNTAARKRLAFRASGGGDRCGHSFGGFGPWHEMKAVAFIEPYQDEVIEKILRHCGLWQRSAPSVLPHMDGWVHELDGCSRYSRTDLLTRREN